MSCNIPSKVIRTIDRPETFPESRWAELNEKEKRNIAVAAQINDCVGRHLFQFAVSIHDRENGYAPFSGTLLSIDDYLFIATAAHVIPRHPNGRLWIATDTVRCESEGFPSFKSYGKTEGEWPDVGYLELDMDIAQKYLLKSPCSIDRVSVVGPGLENHGAILLGGPSERVDVLKVDEHTGIIRDMVDSYFSIPLRPSEWPTTRGESHPLDESVDVIIDYPSDQDLEKDGYGPANLANSRGMSGGGIWLVGTEKEKLWSPDSASLFAIQSRWDPKQRYLRAVQIGHWLRLIVRDYPDLHDTILSRFPDLNRE